MNMIEIITNWNRIAGNKGFDYTLESNMLAEEFAETIIAMKTGDDVELIDGVLDMFIIGIGTLYKKGYTAYQIEQCFDEIMDSNYSKFQTDKEGNEVCVRNEAGKIIKGEGFTPPDIKAILKWDV